MFLICFWFACNQSIHFNFVISFSRAKLFLLGTIRYINNNQSSTTKISQVDLSRLSHLGVKERLTKVPKIITVHWSPPKSTSLKINIDGTASKNQRIAGGGFIVRNCVDLQSVVLPFLLVIFLLL